LIPSTRTAASGRSVVLTDHPWPDLRIEHSVLCAAGYTLVVGPEVAGTAQEVEMLVRQADPIAILTCWAQVSKVAIQFPSHLVIIARLGVGLDNIAVDAASARGAWVTNVPDYCVSEVSDHAIALLLTHYRGIARLDALAKRNGWQTNSSDLERIGDLTVAIIGLGRIGRQTARKLTAFGCRILGLARGATDVEPSVRYTDMAQIHAQADVIILHAPYNDKTSKLINRAFLAGCRRKPLLINVSRGGLVDNDALLEALNAGQLRGAALDVIDGEPAPPLSLIRHPSVIVTPHIAFASRAAIDELRRRACEEVVRVLEGERPLHPCNQPVSGTPLDGGVASDIRVVEGPNGPEVIKRALPKLKVAADWFSDPARSSIEVAAIGAFADLIGPDFVPEVLWSQPEENLFSMRLVDPRLRNWKKDLLIGRIDVRTAIRAGELLGQVHTRSIKRTDLRSQFADTRYFEELRVEPFFLRVAAADRVLGAAIEVIAAGMGQRKSALVHGDYSPKNILADGSDLVILDFEVTHWGDPRFDVAFCLSHLILKAQRCTATSLAVRQVITSFIAGYRTHGPSVLDRDLVQITGCLLLARLEGASPIDYLADIDIPYVRSLAAMMITAPESSIDAYASHFWKPA
jgi:D-3-phosphoglycerate dehydrogenase